MTKQELIDFELSIAKEWDAGHIPYPVHLSGGNEEQLIEIFKDIKPDDWVFSTHRNHYHYLLKGGSPLVLYNLIMRGASMHVMDKLHNFFATGIVAGNCAIAVGVAKSIAEEPNDFRHVWCFIGDGATDEGHFYEAVCYASGQDLPITFIIERNDRSVCSSERDRGFIHKLANFSSAKVELYDYIPTYPHVGTGKKIVFSDMGEVRSTL